MAGTPERKDSRASTAAGTEAPKSARHGSMSSPRGEAKPYTEEEKATDNLVFWPFKKTEKIKVEKLVMNYISSRHGRGRRDDWHVPVRRLGDMRDMVERVDAWHGGSKKDDTERERFLKAHYLYVAMLTHAMCHFPLQDGRIGIAWRWMDTDNKNELYTYSADAEILCVLYNTAILHCEIAGNKPQATMDDCVESMKHFQVAAGIFEHIQNRIPDLPENVQLTPDMSPHILTAQTQLTLAHALHMFYLSRRVDFDEGDAERADKLSRIAHDVAQLYQKAHLPLAHPDYKGASPEVIFFQLEAWWQIFEMRAHIHLAQVCRAKNEVGGELARLTLARECLQRAERSARKMGLRRSYAIIPKSKEELEGAKKAADDRNIGDKEYVEEDSLPPLEGWGKQPIQPTPFRDIVQAIQPTDPFEGIPMLGFVNPRALALHTQERELAPDASPSPIAKPRALRASSASPRGRPNANAKTSGIRSLTPRVKNLFSRK